MIEKIEQGEVFELTSQSGHFVRAFMADGQYVLRFYRGMLQQPGNREAYDDREAFAKRLQVIGQDWRSIGSGFAGSSLNGLV